jgi:hypothetical protein
MPARADQASSKTHLKTVRVSGESWPAMTRSVGPDTDNRRVRQFI